MLPAERLTSALCVIVISDEVMLPSSISFHFSIQIKSLNSCTRPCIAQQACVCITTRRYRDRLPVGPGATAILSFTVNRSVTDEKITSVCPYCGAGCKLKLVVDNNKIIRAEAADGVTNQNQLCLKGYYGWGFS
ncbi:formate dehydrogenase H, selenopolypeptide subunit [Klebsiella pneumoniae subsp. ozaenae]|uniref:Formate dehydrogenase H, selenopolypeptide subunit n=1 Tax=Klebsiella pneumoniae subsp. ozaenae TaxID=574 RepID=A0A378B8N9_KLEPO|nr:formate dehydrogenase H, selenopolypeptide subunit [Klebsiella pneumoniae subsp. ozaenae]